MKWLKANWKTTLAGALAIGLETVKATSPKWAPVADVTQKIVLGGGLIAAADSGKTSAEAPKKEE
jgi:hypothetical protein